MLESRRGIAYECQIHAGELRPDLFDVWLPVFPRSIKGAGMTFCSKAVMAVPGARTRPEYRTEPVAGSRNRSEIGKEPVVAYLRANRGNTRQAFFMLRVRTAHAERQRQVGALDIRQVEVEQPVSVRPAEYTSPQRSPTAFGSWGRSDRLLSAGLGSPLASTANSTGSPIETYSRAAAEHWKRDRARTAPG